MITTYFSYRYKYNTNDWNSRLTPEMNWDNMYPELVGVASMKCELIPESKYKVLPNGNISWVRIGRITFDEVLLASFWKSPTYLEEELARVGGGYALIIETADSLWAFIRDYTTLEEVPPNRFLVSPEWVGMMGEIISAISIDLR
jgi:hypothetical protein